MTAWLQNDSHAMFSCIDGPIPKDAAEQSLKEIWKSDTLRDETEGSPFSLF